MAGRKYPGKVLMMSECCGLHMPGRVGFYASWRRREDAGNRGI